jgi:hypothetical protein
MKMCLFDDMYIHLIYNKLSGLIDKIDYKYDKQNRLLLPELITTQVISFMMFGGSYIKSLNFMTYNKLIPKISESCYSKLIKKNIQVVEYLINMFSLSKSIDNEFVMDTLPVKCCASYRYSKLFTDEEYFGYNASKKEYYTGLKVLLITDLQGLIVNYNITPSSHHDLKTYNNLEYSYLPNYSTLYSDKGFQSKKQEIKELENNIYYKSCLKTNSKEYNPENQRFIIKKRKIIETYINNFLNYTGRNLFKFNTIRTVYDKLKTLILTYNILLNL